MKPKLFVEEWDEAHASSKPRDCTPEELAAHKELMDKIKASREIIRKEEEKLAKLEKSCKHVVLVDTAGWPYDIRSCATCGQGMGLI